MAAKLHLVKGLEADDQRSATQREIRYRYPAHEEAWEVSCEGEGAKEPEKRADDRRRAS